MRKLIEIALADGRSIMRVPCVLLFAVLLFGGALFFLIWPSGTRVIAAACVLLPPAVLIPLLFARNAADAKPGNTDRRQTSFLWQYLLMVALTLIIVDVVGLFTERLRLVLVVGAAVLVLVATSRAPGRKSKRRR